MKQLAETPKTKPSTRGNKMPYFGIFMVFLVFTLSGCSNNSHENSENSLTEEIDEFVLTIKADEKISQEDRNKIYDLAHYLNNKYKGGMESDEIIEVVSQ